jgi:predicted TIM-barrel fold metal-dependent hydrolase
MTAVQPVIDMDTHVGPSLELLKEHADTELLERWDELAPFTNTTTDSGTTTRSTLRVNPIPYRRALRTPSSDEHGVGPGGKGALDNKTVARGTGTPSPGVQHDNPKGRLDDMDLEGVDVHVIIPGTWGLAATAIDQDLALGLYDAYHRYAADYCSADERRLKSLILAAASDPERAATTIRQLGDNTWVCGVALMLPEGTPVDDPGLDPIWDAMGEFDLPLVYHSFFYEAPYFPGYRDIWGNLAVARTAAHPWGAQRIVAYLLLSGMFDLWPKLRIGFSETGAGWLPYWLLRLNMMAEYLPSAVADTKRTPVQYARDGHVYCGIQLYEGPDMAKAIVDVVGDGVLMYQSDYPHGECEWPHSVEHARRWEDVLGADVMAKLMGGNAARFLRLT